MKSVLLFRLGGLGDLLVAFPSIYFLRKKISSCSITLVCREDYGLIFKETGAVDNLVSEGDPRMAPLFAGSAHLDGELVRWLEGFSLVFGWMQKKSSLQIEQSLPLQSRKKSRFFVSDPAYPGQISRYFFDKTAEFLDRGEAPGFNECRILPLSSEQRRDGLTLLGKRVLKEGERFVVVHPGSGSAEKCWPVQNFLEIIIQLNRTGIGGVLVTGRAEARMEDVIEKAQLPENWTWLRNPPLLKLAGLLQSAALYLGNDSGVTHLAAACGGKVVALFREDLADRWRPYGRVSLLRGKPVSRIKLDAVWEAIEVGVRPLKLL
jgi:heptosyltransferase-3